MNVLILNCYSRNALAVINGLGRDHRLVGADARAGGRTPLLPDCCLHSPRLGRVVRYSPPGQDEDRFVADIVAICNSHAIEAIIPTGTITTDALSRHKLRIESETRARAAVENFGMLGRVTDKWHTHEICRAAGLPTPRTQLYAIDNDDPVQDTGALQYPLVLKPRISYASIGVEFARSEDELRRIHQRLRAAPFRSPVSPAYVAQERISGELHDVTACAQQGRPTALLSQQRLLSLYDFGGGGIINRTTHEPAALDIARRFLEYTHWNGVLLFDFIRDNHGDFYLLECNPKIWGTTDLTIQAGANVARMLLDIFVTGETVTPVTDYERDLVYKWWFPECVYHWVHAPRSPRAIARRVRNTLRSYGAGRHIHNLRPGDLRHLLGIVVNRTQL